MLQTTEERQSAMRSRTGQQSQADKELEAMQSYMKKVTSSKKAANAFLEKAGIIDKNGRLAKQYR